MYKSMLASLLVVACAASAPAQAQFSKLLGGGEKKSESAPTADALVNTFSHSQGLVIEAQVWLAQALGLKDQLALLEAEQKAMSSGPTDVDALEKRRALSESAQLAINERIAQEPELSSQARSSFAEGLVSYVLAVDGARDLLVQGKTFLSSAGGNPLGMLGKARAGMYVAKESPGYVRGLAGTTRSLIDYAGKNGIETPANATAALDSL